MLYRNKFFTTVALFFALICIRPIAHAQSEEPKFEAGIQIAALQNGLSSWYEDTSGLGGGGRMTFSLNKNIALEAEMNYFPGSGFYDVRKLQGQFGIKTGVRYHRAGFFGKLRPGFMQTTFEIPIFCIQAPCPPFRERHTDFSVDVGGVVEFYPARRMTVRFDAGDTVVRRNLDLNPIILASQGSLQLYAYPRQA